MKKKKSFTLVEILVVLIILAILAAIAIPIYQNSVNKADMYISAANMEAWWAVIKMDAMEDGIIPNVLGKLQDKNRDKGFAFALKQEGYIKDIFFIKTAYADQNYNQNQGNTNQPGSTTQSQRTASSLPKDVPSRSEERCRYKLNRNLIGVRIRDVLSRTEYAETPIIAEIAVTTAGEAPQFDGNLSEIARPHRYRGSDYGMFIRRDGRVRTVHYVRPSGARSQGEDVVELWEM